MHIPEQQCFRCSASVHQCGWRDFLLFLSLVSQHFFLSQQQFFHFLPNFPVFLPVSPAVLGAQLLPLSTKMNCFTTKTHTLSFCSPCCAVVVCPALSAQVTLSCLEQAGLAAADMLLKTNWELQHAGNF